MTREQAIDIIKNLPIYRAEMEYDKHSELMQALEMAIGDMEKQIPLKPLDVVTDYNEFICMICPSCEQIAVEFNDKYCRRCGQALDWSVEHD